MTTLNQVITVTAGALQAQKQLCTLEAVLDELGIDGGSEPTCRKINRKINAASARLLKFTHLGEFAFQRYTVRVPGLADDTLMLPRTPVSNLISVAFLPSSGALETPPGLGVDITGQVELIDPDAGILRSRFGFQWNPMIDWSLRKALTEFGNPVPGTEDPNYEVVFEAGWRLPGQQATEPSPIDPAIVPKLLPADLEEACLSLVVRSFTASNDPAISAGLLKKRQVDSTTAEFFSPGDAALAEQFGLTSTAFYNADPYRRAA